MNRMSTSRPVKASSWWLRHRLLQGSPGSDGEGNHRQGPGCGCGLLHHVHVPNTRHLYGISVKDHAIAIQGKPNGEIFYQATVDSAPVAKRAKL